MQHSHNVAAIQIHPSILFCLSGVELRRCQAEKGIPDLLLPSNAFQLLMVCIVPPASSGSASGSPPSWWEAPGKHPDRMPEPSQLAPFNIKIHIYVHIHGLELLTISIINNLIQM